MKALTSLIIASALLAGYQPSTSANDAMSLRICEYVQANDKQRLRKYLKQQKLKIRNVYGDLRCNQDNLLVFAAKSKSLDVGEFLLKQLPSKVVAKEVDNIAAHSAHIAEKAKERIK